LSLIIYAELSLLKLYHIFNRKHEFFVKKIYKLSAHPKENFKGGRGGALKKVAPTLKIFFWVGA